MTATDRRRTALRWKSLLSAAIACLLAESSGASTIDLGHSFRVPELGLDWLALTRTKNRSYDDVVADAGLAGEGWRYATSDEICDLFIMETGAPIQEGCPIPDGFGEETGDAGTGVLIDLFGVTFRAMDFEQAGAVFDDGNPTNNVGRAVLQEIFAPPTFKVVVQANLFPSSSPSNILGSFLVRDIALENLIFNGRLTQDLDGWGLSEGGQWSSLGAGGSIGSLLQEVSGCPDSCSIVAFSQCVPAVLGDELYTLSGEILVPTPGAQTPVTSGRALTRWFDTPNCLGTPLRTDFAELITQQGSWIPYQLELVAPTGAQSVLVGLRASWNAADEPAVVYFDDQVLNLPEPDGTLLAIVALATLASLSTRVRSSRVRKPLT